jgi:hypothetical protein
MLVGVLLAGAGIAAAWRAAPLTAHATDLTAILTAAAEAEARSVARDADVVYVFPGEIASTLRQGTRLRLEPGARRPQDPSGCDPGSGAVAVKSCGRDDYVQVAIQSIPLWRVALVSVTTQGSRHEKLLIKPAGDWIVVGTRGYAL